MDLKELIYNYKVKNQVTNTEIARRAHVTKATVSRWLSGDVKRVQNDTMEHLKKLFGYDVEALLSGHIVSFKKPVYDKARCFDAQAAVLAEEHVSAQAYDQGDYFLKLEGDEMLRADSDETLAYIATCHEMKDGMTGVFRIVDELVIARLILKGDMMIFESRNPRIASRYMTLEEADTLGVTVIGRVLYTKTKYDGGNGNE